MLQSSTNWLGPQRGNRSIASEIDLCIIQFKSQADRCITGSTVDDLESITIPTSCLSEHLLQSKALGWMKSAFN